MKTVEKTKTGEDGRKAELYNARIKAGLSRKQLAKLAGIGMTTYVRCELGEADMTQKNRERVAAVLGKPVDTFWKDPYMVHCRRCKKYFVQEKREAICKECREAPWADKKIEMRNRSRNNQEEIRRIVREAAMAGMSYGKYTEMLMQQKEG